MATRDKKNEDNVSGRFFVDDQCIACDACIVEAPIFFKMNLEKGHAYVAKQPSTEKEVLECKQALESCPVDAIGEEE